jgi:hypothetical protein
MGKWWRLERDVLIKFMMRSLLRGMEEAINLAAELDVIRAKFETDAMQLVSALNNRTPDFSSEATIIEDLKTQSRTWFSSCSFKSSRRCTKCSCPCTSSGRNEM